MTRKEWLATLTDRDPHAVLLAQSQRARLDDLIETETVQRDPSTVAKERQLLGILDQLGVRYSLPFHPGDSDTIIPQIMQASAAATGDTRDAIQDAATIALTIWQGLGTGIYDEHLGQASYNRERRVPQYGPTPVEEYGFEPYTDVFEVQRELAEVTP